MLDVQDRTVVLTQQQQMPYLLIKSMQFKLISLRGPQDGGFWNSLQLIPAHQPVMTTDDLEDWGISVRDIEEVLAKIEVRQAIVSHPGFGLEVLRGFTSWNLDHKATINGQNEVQVTVNVGYIPPDVIGTFDFRKLCSDM